METKSCTTEVVSVEETVVVPAVIKKEYVLRLDEDQAELVLSLLGKVCGRFGNEINGPIYMSLSKALGYRRKFELNTYGSGISVSKKSKLDAEEAPF